VIRSRPDRREHVSRHTLFPKDFGYLLPLMTPCAATRLVSGYDVTVEITVTCTVELGIRV